MKKPIYVIVSALLSVVLHIVLLTFGDRILFPETAVSDVPEDRRVRVTTMDISKVTRPPRTRQDVTKQAERMLRDAVRNSEKVKKVFDAENLAEPPKAQVRLAGLGRPIREPQLPEPEKARPATAPRPKIIEIDAADVPLERLASERLFQKKLDREDIPTKFAPSMLAPGPLAGAVGRTFDVGMLMGKPPRGAGIRPEDIPADGGMPGANLDAEAARTALLPRGGGPGLQDLGAGAGAGRATLGGEVAKSLDEFVTVTVTVYEERRGGGYFRADISPNPRSEALPDVAKDILFIIDHSTSISAPKLEQFKAGTAEALQYLNPKDRFNVVSFTDRPKALFPEFTSVSAETIEQAQKYVRGLFRGGMTDVFGSVAPFVASSNNQPERPLNVFLMSDGNSTVNIYADDEFVRRIVQMNPGNVSIYSFSAGSKANRDLMEFLGYHNRGFSLHVEDLSRFKPELVRYMSTHTSLLVADLKYHAAGGLNDQIFPKRLPHLYRNEILSIYGRYEEGVDELILSLTGRDGAGKLRELVFRRKFEDCPRGSAELAQNWAAQKVFHLVGQRTLTTDAARKQEIERQISSLAKTFSLYVPY
jgi:hypothetical protein